MKTNRLIAIVALAIIGILSPIICYIGYCETIKRYTCSSDGLGLAFIVTELIFLIVWGNLIINQLEIGEIEN